VELQDSSDKNDKKNVGAEQQLVAIAPKVCETNKITITNV
jgi:hypothetical protein